VTTTISFSDLSFNQRRAARARFLIASLVGA
jgi:hypothetical protein